MMLTCAAGGYGHEYMNRCELPIIRFQEEAFRSSRKSISIRVDVTLRLRHKRPRLRVIALSDWSTGLPTSPPGAVARKFDLPGT